MVGIQKMKLLIAEDCQLASQLFAEELAGDFDIEYVDTIAGFVSYVEHCTARPDLLVLDLLFKGHNVLDTVGPRQLATKLEGWKWVVLSSHLDAHNMDKAYMAGALDCIDKLQGAKAIVARIHRAAYGSFHGNIPGFKINNKNRFVYLKQHRTERPLSPIELSIVNCLFEARERRATRDEILWEIFETRVGTNIDRHIASLKKALKKLPGVEIETIKGGAFALKIGASNSDI